MTVAARFDRQLRLWGEQGQACLEETLLLVLGLSTTSLEALESLCVSGLRHLVIVDNAQVLEEDLSATFALGRATPGQLKGEATLQYLRDLAPSLDPGCKAVPMSPVLYQKSLQADPSKAVALLSDYEHLRAVIVLASAPANSLSEPLKTEDVVAIRRLFMHTHQLDCAVAIFKQVGPYSSFRCDADGWLLQNARLSAYKLSDLGLSHPFPALRRLAAESLAQATRVETPTDPEDVVETPPPRQPVSLPFVLLLVFALSEYEAAHGPLGDARPADLKRFIIESVDKLDSTKINSDCIAEARKYAHLCCKTSGEEMPPGFQRSLRGDTDTLLIHQRLFKYIHEFVQGNKGQCVLSDQLPDMLSDTDVYLKLKQCYRDRVTQQIEQVVALVPADEPYRDQIRDLLTQSKKSLRQMMLIGASTDATPISRQNPYADTLELESITSTQLCPPQPCEALETLNQSLSFPKRIPSVCCLKIAFDTLSEDDAGLASTDELHSRYLLRVQSVVRQEQLSEAAAEALRDLRTLDHMIQCAGHPQVHYNLCSGILGGVIASELTKLMTRNFVPFTSVDLVWDGVTSRAGTF